MPDRILSVLVVDDSAVVRQFMTQMLGRQPDLHVRVAADPIFALAKIEAERPDVILLDLETPRLHGLDFLRDLMASNPIPVVVCSSFVGPGSDTAIRALEDGALDLVSKPQFGVREFLAENATVLADKLRAAASARVTPRRATSAAQTSQPVRRNAPSAAATTTRDVIAIGASTGGTEAIQLILQALPETAPPVLVTQHMPAGFTKSFANRLDSLCAIRVKEAEAGDRLRPGCAFIAPGNQHLKVRRDGAYYVTEIVEGPLVSRHRPSVDVLFSSMAANVGAHGTGVILTGMGSDGADGLNAMRKSGARTIAQDEGSCVVFGMPKEAIALGAVQQVLPIEAIAEALLQPRVTR